VSLCTDPHAGHKAFLAAVRSSSSRSTRYDFNQPTPVNVAGYYQKTSSTENATAWPTRF
jgi:hypothetical protein